MKLSLHCTCGAVLVGEVSPKHCAERIRGFWLAQHTGYGHTPCDAKAAARARAKFEKQATQEDR